MALSPAGDRHEGTSVFWDCCSQAAASQNMEIRSSQGSWVHWLLIAVDPGALPAEVTCPGGTQLQQKRLGALHKAAICSWDLTLPGETSDPLPLCSWPAPAALCSVLPITRESPSKAAAGSLTLERK